MRMKGQRAHSGQTLVQVAILMVVLLAFAAFAIDFGRIYLERRLLQNAADAGALAWARAQCFGNGIYASPEDAATTVALQNIPARAVTPEIDVQPLNDTVRVTVREKNLPTFLAPVVKLTGVDVGATARAQCGRAITAGGLWPLTVKKPDWTLLPCPPDPGSVFTVFTAQSENQVVDCYDASANPNGECNCQAAALGSGQMYPNNPDYFRTLLNNGAVSRLGPGQRGWVDMPEVLPPAPNPGECGGCGGNNNVACWMQWTHPGPVAVCDRLGSESGVAWSNGVREAVELHRNLGDIINIPLWDNECPLSLEGTSTCKGDYLVAGFGCMRILGYAPLDFFKRTDPSKKCQYGSNLKVIFAQKICDCQSYSGGTGGQSCEPPNVCSVSLIE